MKFVPYGERLACEKADSFANVLETLDRGIAPNLLREPAAETERRFTTAENRMLSVWRSYGKL